MNKLKALLVIIGLLILAALLCPKEKKEQDEMKTEEPVVEEIDDPKFNPDRIRVVLKDHQGDDIYHDEVVFKPDTDYEVLSDGKSRICKAGEIYRIAADEFECQAGAMIKICIIPISENARTAISTIERHQGTPVYRGKFELQRSDDGIIIINDLPIEEYLYAVVVSEMPSDYPMEALMAQAICARTYAVKQMQHSKYTELGAHVDDSTSFQVYNDLAEDQNVNMAVDATKGRVVTYHGEVQDTYYFSTSCGYTSDGGAWKRDADTDMGYLESRRLSEKAVAAWAADRTEGEAEEDTFEAFIRGEDPDDYECSEPWYRWEMEIERVALSGMDEKLRKRYEINPDQILTKQKDGTFQSVEPPAVGELQDIRIEERGEGGVIERLIIEGSHATIQILTEYNIRYILAAEGAPVKRHTGEAVSCGILLPSAFFVMEPVYEKDQIRQLVLYGGGYGHGTGLSQNCAKNMALKGMKAEEIVRYFYHDVEINDLPVV